MSTAVDFICNLHLAFLIVVFVYALREDLQVMGRWLERPYLFWPYMIPFSITVDQAAAPHSRLAFMFWGEGLFVLPLMLAYTAIAYRVFRGKVQSTSHHY